MLKQFMGSRNHSNVTLKGTMKRHGARVHDSKTKQKSYKERNTNLVKETYDSVPLLRIFKYIVCISCAVVFYKYTDHWNYHLLSSICFVIEFPSFLCKEHLNVREKYLEIEYPMTKLPHSVTM